MWTPPVGSHQPPDSYQTDGRGPDTSIKIGIEKKLNQAESGTNRESPTHKK